MSAILTHIEISEAAAAHRRNLPYTANARLGANHLSRLYQSMLDNPQSSVIVAREQDRIIGLIAGTKSVENLKKAIFSGYGFFNLIKLFFRLLLSPGLVLQLGREIYHTRSLEDSAYLTVLFVEPDQRKHGIAAKLLQSLEFFFRELGVKEYGVDTTSSNAIARAFYQRYHFQVISEKSGNIYFRKKL